MATPYETIYNRFLQKCTDYDLPNVPQDELESMLHGWMTSAVSRFTQSVSDLSKRDDELRTFSIDLEDYEQEVISLFMVVAWLEPRVNSTLLTSQFFGGKEEKYYSQAAHLQTLIALRDGALNDAKKLIRDNSYRSINSYFS
jgi:hypothetical protein